MSAIINVTDFVGSYAISTDMYQGQNLELLINELEQDTLIQLLGKELYDLFIADLNNGVPQSARFLDIFNAITFDCDCIDEDYSSGIKPMLLAIVYFNWQRKNYLQTTAVGMASTNVTNGIKPKFTPGILTNVYNTGIRNYKVIQAYIRMNIATYPEFKGVNKDFCSLF